ncbi:MAG: HlyD family efflux transporter periplasmic adaptor subunit [Cytophagales bacterium]|nr:HlyD family efflux transporter periplasmic adaptor subunit [Bernardetiaceae bacterium]MDW8210955.1 HlyD family efflux transporter periplasmic adaptor subunit [Cytophagales bacterium]
MAKRNHKLYLIGSIAIVALVIFAAIARRQGWIGTPKATEVILAKVRRSDIVEKISASGKVQPETEVKLSPLVSGEVIEVLVKEGDSVTTGQVLVKIKPDNLRSILERAEANLNAQRANLAQAKARVEQAKAQLIRRKQELDRTKILHAQKAVSDADLETATANYEIAQAELQSAEQSVEAARFTVLSAEAQVKEASENLSFTVITAPMSGIVSKLNIEKGERVVGTSQMAGTELLRIADMSTMEVRVDVNENDIIRVKKGDSAIVEVDSYAYQGIKFIGVVTQIANSAKETPGQSSDAITEFEVRIRILRHSYEQLIKERGGEEPFRPGMTANVEIITNRKNGVLAVPLAAVTTRTEKKPTEATLVADDPNTPQIVREEKKAAFKEAIQEVVFINQHGKAKMVKVKTGISDFENIEILSGLKEGDEVVAGPFLVVSKTLQDGDPIKPMKSPEK